MTDEAILKLARFGAWCARELHHGNIYGINGQDKMNELDIIVMHEFVTEPCGDVSCWCAEEFGFPTDCYRYPPDIAAAVKELAPRMMRADGGEDIPL